MKQEYFQKNQSFRFQGVKIKIDDSGNVWIKSSENNVITSGILGEQSVQQNPIKIFDLKVFKDMISGQRGFDESARDPYSRLAITYIYVDKPANALSSALWFAVIHLAALEMIQILLPTTSVLQTAPSLANHDFHNVHNCFNAYQQQCNGADMICNARTASSSSSGSSPYYSGASFYCNRQASHVAHYQHQKEKGRSLLNLNDLDRLQNSTYFQQEVGNFGDLKHRKHNQHYAGNTSTSPLVHCCEPNNWRSRSETSLCCERL
ncbi:unnamed protein product [Thelazia callipaeda]|uniref:MH2 domain-containing protein n=1 Tax=Thelazia callipaeda TaxID=103827 RepID=A0A3P7KN87_THECL|nr:unnamed protein product [Thelazia callipaeda]